MYDLLADPWFYAAALPAVILVGLSKGGFGGAMGFVGVPLMALVMSPVQAAAILLPILVLMDMVSLWTWRGVYDRPTLAIMLPGAVVGIGAGWLTAAMVTPDMVRFLVGMVAILFVARWFYQLVRHGSDRKTDPSGLLGAFWGTVAGFTSFVAHVGGPPFQIYALPLKMDPESLHRHQRHLLRHNQRAEADPLFRARPIRCRQPYRLGRADADRTAGDARRGLAGAPYATGNLLPPHLRHCRGDRRQAHL